MAATATCSCVAVTTTDEFISIRIAHQATLFVGVVHSRSPNADMAIVRRTAKNPWRPTPPPNPRAIKRQRPRGAAFIFMCVRSSQATGSGEPRRGARRRRKTRRARAQVSLGRLVRTSHDSVDGPSSNREGDLGLGSEEGCSTPGDAQGAGLASLGLAVRLRHRDHGGTSICGGNERHRQTRTLTCHGRGRDGSVMPALAALADNAGWDSMTMRRSPNSLPPPIPIPNFPQHHPTAAISALWFLRPASLPSRRPSFEMVALPGFRSLSIVAPSTPSPRTARFDAIPVLGLPQAGRRGPSASGALAGVQSDKPSPVISHVTAVGLACEGILQRRARGVH
ncbi:hypothetical protein G7Z17_g12291 [Cylindrodendrum hubeiense]|uniref:Uncharacterized protein n=1 Tax=Cylindrodendrum hubeiense TaxID=595255 RepID=A0A9P5L9F1_9HYPO|nr:hypothetical protein G7Z17_g12291 [Cylindrodendrum hubeiense]